MALHSSSIISPPRQRRPVSRLESLSDADFVDDLAALLNTSESESGEESDSGNVPMSPEKPEFARSRTSDPANWKQNRRKTAFQRGEAFEDEKGELNAQQRL